MALTTQEWTDLVKNFAPTVVAVLGIGASVLLARRSLAAQSARDLANARLAYRLRQLNELYAPLSIKIGQNELLHKRLTQGKPDPPNWRLLENIDAVLANETDRHLAQEIVKVDEEIAEIIQTKAGLVDGDEPASFAAFLGHVSVLKLAMAGKKPPAVTEFQLYPRTLNDDVRGGLKRVRTELQITLK